MPRSTKTPSRAEMIHKLQVTEALLAKIGSGRYSLLMVRYWALRCAHSIHQFLLRPEP